MRCVCPGLGGLGPHEYKLIHISRGVSSLGVPKMVSIFTLFLAPTMLCGNYGSKVE